MTLRRRTALAVLAACAVAVVVLFFSLQGIMSAHAATLERQEANQDLERAANALSREIAGIEALVGDWAHRDDTYQFALSGNPQFAAGNLDAAALADMGVNFTILTDPSSQTVYSKAVDLSSGDEVVIPAGLEQYLTDDGLLLGHSSETSSTAGILFLPEHLAMAASQPILTSLNQGPIAGTLIMGRYLGLEELENLSETTGLSLELHRVDEPDLPADFEAARSSLSDERSSRVQIVNGGTVGAYMLVNEIHGGPAFVLRVDGPRDVYAEGQRTARHALYLILGLGALFAALLILEVDLVLLSRLRRFSARVEQVRRSHNLSERVPVQGKDELATVAETVNGTLDSLEQSYLHLAESQARHEALVDSMPDLVFRMNREGTINEIKRPRQATSAADGHGSLLNQRFSEDQIGLLSAHMRQTAVPHVEEALRSRQLQVFQFQISANSHTTAYEARVMANGNDEALIVVRDVTQQRQADEALQNSLLLEEMHHRIGDLRQYLMQGLQRSAAVGPKPPAQGDPPSCQGEPPSEGPADSGVNDAKRPLAGEGIEADTAPGFKRTAN